MLNEWCKTTIVISILFSMNTTKPRAGLSLEVGIVELFIFLAALKLAWWQ